MCYAQLALDFEPALNEIYADRLNQIVEWCRSSGQRTISGRFPASDGPPFFEIDKKDKMKRYKLL